MLWMRESAWLLLACGSLVSGGTWSLADGISNVSACGDLGTIVLDFHASCTSDGGFKPRVNNLNGIGPDYGQPEEMRFADIANVGGTQVSLVITTPDASYHVAASPATHGCKTWLAPHGPTHAGIGMQNGQKVRFNFAFQDATGAPFVMPSFYINFFDIENGNSGGGYVEERLWVYGYDTYFTDKGTRLATVAETSAHGNGLAVTTDWGQTILDTETKHMIAFKMRAASSFMMEYEVTKGGSLGRALGIAGSTPLTEYCTALAPHRSCTPDAELGWPVPGWPSQCKRVDGRIVCSNPSRPADGCPRSCSCRTS